MDVAAGEPSPGADVAGISRVPAQMWAGVSPVPAQMWQGCAPEDEQRARATALRFVEVRRVLYSAKCSVALSRGQLCSTWPCNAVPMRVLYLGACAVVVTLAAHSYSAAATACTASL